MQSRFIIYRIIGNALPPRHGPRDSIDHLQQFLENETSLADCENRWLLNRFVDPDVEARCIELIEQKGDAYHVIPFDRIAFRASFLDASGMPRDYNPMIANLPTDSVVISQVVEWTTRHKSQQLININQARNVALDLGHKDAEWTIPLDGSCYFTKESWELFVSRIDASPEALYGIIALKRLSQGQKPELIGGETYEPQIAFHRQAPDRFDERLRYGSRNKAELLVRLGVPGEWHIWNGAAWDNETPLTAKAPGRYVTASCVFRAAPGAESVVELSNQNRFIARFSGVRALSFRVDSELLYEKVRHRVTQWAGPPLSLDVADHVVDLAEKICTSRIPLITDKTVMPPSGNKNDYISAPRYLHRINGTLVKRDGIARAEAIIGSKEGRQYDRSALHDCIHYASTLIVAGISQSNQQYLDRAVRILECWFIDPETAMTPHARYAQFRPTLPDETNPHGIVDFRDLWMLPRLAQLLLASGALTTTQYARLQNWARAFIKHRETSPDSLPSYRATNNIGTWTTLLTASLSLFAGNVVIANNKLCESTMRLCAHCGAIGSQPEELVRHTPLHYSLFNATAWTLLAGFARKLDFDLWRFQGAEGQSISAMLRFIARNMDSFPEYKGRESYFANWFGALALQVPPDAVDYGKWALIRGEAGLNFNDPDTGLPSQWGYLIGPA